ncbi:MAG: hypothetical protein VX252_09550 [Myxococcota bacterium]|nr:hypothetical protein [Myxococcota bacterium]
MRRHSNFGLTYFFVFLGMVLSSMAMAGAQDSSSRCAAAIEKAAGKNASCLLFARSRFSLNQNEESLETKLELCHQSFLSQFRRALRKNGEENCPTVDAHLIEKATLSYVAQIVADIENPDSADSTNENDLFNQPDSDDNTCGIRQLLLAQDELTGNHRYTGDILALWRAVRGFTLKNYPLGDLAGLVGDAGEERFTRPIPDAYDILSVKAAQGGPETLPSSAIMASSLLGLRFEKFYLDRANAADEFTEGLVEAEVDRIQAYAPGSVVDFEVGRESLSDVVSNPEHYYMIVVNGGDHWVGATTRTVNDSLDPGSVASEPALENLDNFGIIMEFSLAP